MNMLLPTTVIALVMLSGSLGTPALASADSRYEGGCLGNFTTDTLADEGQIAGVIDIAAVVYSTGTPFDNPVTATVLCYITVNGATQPGTELSAYGTTVVVGAGVVSYAAAEPDDDVELCTSVDFSDATPTVTRCEPLTVHGWRACARASAFTGSRGRSGVVRGWLDDLGILGGTDPDCPPYLNVQQSVPTWRTPFTARQSGGSVLQKGPE